VLSAVITLLVLAARSRSGDAGRTAAPQVQPPAAVRQALAGGTLSVNDFLLEEESEGPAQPYLLRPPAARWSPEQVQRYWVPVKDVILDIVSRQSDRRIDEILEGVR